MDDIVDHYLFLEFFLHLLIIVLVQSLCLPLFLSHKTTLKLVLDYVHYLGILIWGKAVGTDQLYALGRRRRRRKMSRKRRKNMIGNSTPHPRTCRNYCQTRLVLRLSPGNEKAPPTTHLTERVNHDLRYLRIRLQWNTLQEFVGYGGPHLLNHRNALGRIERGEEEVGKEEKVDEREREEECAVLYLCIRRTQAGEAKFQQLML